MSLLKSKRNVLENTSHILPCNPSEIKGLRKRKNQYN